MGLIGLVQRLTSGNAVLSWFALKTTVVGGMVYYSYHEGLWSKPEETAKLYVKLYDNVVPYVKENIPKEITQELPQLPSAKCISNFAKTSWNKGVMISVGFVADLPTHVTNSTVNLSELVQKYMKELGQ